MAKTLKFAWRGDQIDARYGYGVSGAVYSENATTSKGITTVAGAISSTGFDCTSYTSSDGIMFNGFNNMPTSKQMTIVIGGVPNYTGNAPSVTQRIFTTTGNADQPRGAFELVYRTDDMRISMWADTGSSVISDAALTANFTATSGTRNDYVAVLDFTTGSIKCSGFINGSYTTSTITSGSLISDNSTLNPAFMATIQLGGRRNAGDSFAGWFDELLIFEGEISAASVASAFPGGSRAYYSTAALDLASFSDPGIANVKKDTTYTYEGSTLTGTLESTNPGAGNVANGTNYIIESTTYTGSAVVLTAGSGASGTLDINNIKEQIQTILETANTTTASPIDLSSNLANSVRVQTIAKFNPDKLPREITAYPMITCWIDGKSIEHATIAKNQRTGKRRADVDVKVMGMVFNPNHADDNIDPADEDINYLMENIELTLRAFPKLGGGDVITSIPEGTTYYRDYLSSEQTHVRAGVIDLKVTTYY
jgi:hypothetical protein